MVKRLHRTCHAPPLWETLKQRASTTRPVQMASPGLLQNTMAGNQPERGVCAGRPDECICRENNRRLQLPNAGQPAWNTVPGPVPRGAFCRRCTSPWAMATCSPSEGLRIRPCFVIYTNTLTQRSTASVRQRPPSHTERRPGQLIDYLRHPCPRLAAVDTLMIQWHTLKPSPERPAGVL